MKGWQRFDKFGVWCLLSSHWQIWTTFSGPFSLLVTDSHWYMLWKCIWYIFRKIYKLTSFACLWCWCTSSLWGLSWSTDMYSVWPAQPISTTSSAQTYLENIPIFNVVKVHLQRKLTLSNWYFEGTVEFRWIFLKFIIKSKIVFSKTPLTVDTWL